MCVIMIVVDDEKRPRREMIEAAFETNSDGAGVAWREDGKIHWKKGLNLEEITDFLPQLPTPYVSHFRIASCGGPLPELCHPFEVNMRLTPELSGSTVDRVLFHNGHYGRWKDLLFNYTTCRGLKLPEGKWSDTRAMAWAGAISGDGMFEIFDEKLVHFGTDILNMYGREGSHDWHRYEGIWVSNSHFEGRCNKRFFGKASGKGGVSGGGSIYTTPPASMAGDDHCSSSSSSLVTTPVDRSIIDQGSGSTSAGIPFNRGKEDRDCAPTRKQLQKIRKHQEKLVRKALKARNEVQSFLQTETH